jgi:hypothetical protein
VGVLENLGKDSSTEYVRNTQGAQSRKRGARKDADRRKEVVIQGQERQNELFPTTVIRAPQKRKAMALPYPPRRSQVTRTPDTLTHRKRSQGFAARAKRERWRYFWYVGRRLIVEARLEPIQGGIRILRPWPARKGKERRIAFGA